MRKNKKFISFLAVFFSAIIIAVFSVFKIDVSWTKISAAEENNNKAQESAMIDNDKIEQNLTQANCADIDRQSTDDALFVGCNGFF